MLKKQGQPKISNVTIKTTTGPAKQISNVSIKTTTGPATGDIDKNFFMIFIEAAISTKRASTCLNALRGFFPQNL